MLRSDLYDYRDAYIVVKGTINLLAAAAKENDKAEKDVGFKNNAPFRSSISKINNTLIDNAEDLDIAMSMHNLLEYSDHYSMISGSLWNYYRDKIDYVGVVVNASDGKSFEYKTKIVGGTSERLPQPGNPRDLDRQAQPPLSFFNVKSLFHSNIFAIFGDLLCLDLPLMNCEVKLDLL